MLFCLILHKDCNAALSFKSYSGWSSVLAAVLSELTPSGCGNVQTSVLEAGYMFLWSYIAVNLDLPSDSSVVMKEHDLFHSVKKNGQVELSKTFWLPGNFSHSWFICLVFPRSRFLMHVFLLFLARSFVFLNNLFRTDTLNCVVSHVGRWFSSICFLKIVIFAHAPENSPAVSQRCWQHFTGGLKSIFRAEFSSRSM